MKIVPNILMSKITLEQMANIAASGLPLDFTDM